MRQSVLFLFLVACAGHQPVVSIDPAFQSYVDQWHSDARLVGHGDEIDDLIIEFGSLLQLGEKGVCFTGVGYTPTIQIDVTWWNEPQDPIQLKYLIYHELGHCILNRVHNNKMIAISNGASVYESIMNPYAYIDDYYDANYHQHILEEYFYGQ